MRSTRARLVTALALALILSSLATPLIAQPPEKLHRIGMLERTSAAINAANVEGFRRALGLTVPPSLLVQADQVIQ